MGCEGVVGVSGFLAGGVSTNSAIVECSGTAYRMAVPDFMREFENDANMRVLMLSYAQFLIIQMGQTSVCNRHHHLDQQLCRWLLLCLDRLPTSELPMTQELIAHVLGVRREGVTQAASKLQKLGIIRYRRGHITVLDRPQLEAICCECYKVIKQGAYRLGLTYDCEGAAIAI